jgi:hypothetical protein
MVQGHPGVWEMTWAPDGRATFEYGRSVGEDQRANRRRRRGAGRTVPRRQAIFDIKH